MHSVRYRSIPAIRFDAYHHGLIPSPGNNLSSGKEVSHGQDKERSGTHQDDGHEEERRKVFLGEIFLADASRFGFQNSIL